MVDAPLRNEPVPSEPVSADGVRISLAPPMSRFSLRARSHKELENVTGSPIPSKIGSIENDVLCIGPDEWLLRTDNTGATLDSAGRLASVVDVSERSIGITIEGARCVELLLCGSPLDLEKFAVGYGTRTIFEGVEIILIRAGQDRFEMDVWRSFAPFVWGILAKAAKEL